MSGIETDEEREEKRRRSALWELMSYIQKDLAIGASEEASRELDQIVQRIVGQLAGPDEAPHRVVRPNPTFH